MKIAKVIGNIWATRKDQKLNSLTLLIVQCINVETGENDGAPIVAADMIGAGFGETVIIVGGSSARTAVENNAVPVDATVTAIVDSYDLAGKK